MTNLIADLLVKINGDVSGLNSSLSQANSGVQNFTQKTNAALSGANKTLGGLGSAARMAMGPMLGLSNAFQGFLGRLMGGLALFNQAQQGAVALARSIGMVAQSLLSGNAEMESYETTLKVLLGGVDQAKARLAELTKFAAQTPFELPEIVQASITLESLTQGAMSAGKGLTLIGDAASAVQQPYNDLAIIIGRVYSGLENGGQGIGMELMRLTELGLVTGKTRIEVQKLVDAGGDMDKAWALIEKDIARFSGQMQEQSQTFKGLFSTLKDNISMFTRAATKSLFDFTKGGLKALVDFVGSPKVQNFGATLSDQIGVKLVYLQKVFSEVFARIGAMWDRFGPSITATFKQVVATVAPILQQLGKLIQTHIGGMAQRVGIVWEKFLQPALRQFSTFLEEHIIPMVQRVSEVLSSVLPTAASLASQIFSSVLVPVLGTVADIITNYVAPAFKQIAEWAGVHLPPLIQALSRLWTELLGPALTELARIATQVVLPALLQVAGFLVDTLGGAINFVVDAWKILVHAWETDWAGMRSVVESVGGVIGTVLGAIWEALKKIWEFGSWFLKPIFDAFHQGATEADQFKVRFAGATSEVARSAEAMQKATETALQKMYGEYGVWDEKTKKAVDSVLDYFKKAQEPARKAGTDTSGAWFEGWTGGLNLKAPEAWNNLDKQCREGMNLYTQGYNWGGNTISGWTEGALTQIQISGEYFRLAGEGAVAQLDARESAATLGSLVGLSFSESLIGTVVGALTQLRTMITGLAVMPLPGMGALAGYLPSLSGMIEGFVGAAVAKRVVSGKDQYAGIEGIKNAPDRWLTMYRKQTGTQKQSTTGGNGGNGGNGGSGGGGGGKGKEISALEAMVNMAKLVKEGINAALEAIAGILKIRIPESVGPKIDELARFFDMVVSKIQAVALKYGAEGMEAVRAFTDSASGIFGLFNTVFDFFTKMADTGKRVLDPANRLAALTMVLADKIVIVMNTLGPRIALWDEFASMKMQSFSEAAGAAFGAFNTTFDFFVKIAEDGRRVLAPQNDLAALTDALSEKIVIVMNKLGERIPLWDDFANNAISAFMGATKTVFEGLGVVYAFFTEIVKEGRAVLSPSNDLASLTDQISEKIVIVMNKLGERIPLWDDFANTKIAAFATSTGTVAGALGAVFSLFRDIAKEGRGVLAPENNIAALADSISEKLVIVMNRLGERIPLWDQFANTKIKGFAESTAVVVETLGGGLALFSDLFDKVYTLQRDRIMQGVNALFDGLDAVLVEYTVRSARLTGLVKDANTATMTTVGQFVSDLGNTLGPIAELGKGGLIRLAQGTITALLDSIDTMLVEFSTRAARFGGMVQSGEELLASKIGQFVQGIGQTMETIRALGDKKFFMDPVIAVKSLLSAIETMLVEFNMGSARLAKMIDPDKVTLAQQIGSLVQSVGQAIEPLVTLSGMKALKPSDKVIDSVFDSLEKVLGHFAQRALKFAALVTGKKDELAKTLGDVMQGLGAAIDPLLKILAFQVPTIPKKEGEADGGGGSGLGLKILGGGDSGFSQVKWTGLDKLGFGEGIDGFFNALEAVLNRFVEKAKDWAKSVTPKVAEVATTIGVVFDTIGKAIEPILKMGEVQKITPANIEGSLANVWLALHHFNEVMKSGELQGDWGERAVAFAGLMADVFDAIGRAFAALNSIPEVKDLEAKFQTIKGAWAAIFGLPSEQGSLLNLMFGKQETAFFKQLDSRLGPAMTDFRLEFGNQMKPLFEWIAQYFAQEAAAIGPILQQIGMSMAYQIALGILAGKFYIEEAIRQALGGSGSMPGEPSIPGLPGLPGLPTKGGSGGPRTQGWLGSGFGWGSKGGWGSSGDQRGEQTVFRDAVIVNGTLLIQDPDVAKVLVKAAQRQSDRNLGNKLIQYTAGA